MAESDMRVQMADPLTFKVIVAVQDLNTISIKICRIASDI